jgi:hypothetical protein
VLRVSRKWRQRRRHAEVACLFDTAARHLASPVCTDDGAHQLIERLSARFADHGVVRSPLSVEAITALKRSLHKSDLAFLAEFENGKQTDEIASQYGVDVSFVRERLKHAYSQIRNAHLLME